LSKAIIEYLVQCSVCTQVQVLKCLGRHILKDEADPRYGELAPFSQFASQLADYVAHC
jgi:hypothetical protein